MRRLAPPQFNQAKKENIMSLHKAEISKEAEGSYFALIVRIDRDGQENVIRGYKPRHFKTRANAEKSTQNYMKKWSL